MLKTENTPKHLPDFGNMPVWSYFAAKKAVSEDMGIASAISTIKAFRFGINEKEAFFVPLMWPIIKKIKDYFVTLRAMNTRLLDYVMYIKYADGLIRYYSESMSSISSKRRVKKKEKDAGVEELYKYADLYTMMDVAECFRDSPIDNVENRTLNEFFAALSYLQDKGMYTERYGKQQ